MALAALLLAAAFLFAVLRTPGFHGDESSIALNAWSIATTGADEHGVRWPVYFEAFGEWKNPPYIYALAAVFRASGPSNAAARATSAMLVLLAALAACSLGWRAGGGSGAAAGLLLSLSFPWWFDIGRFVFEVAVFPLASILFLLGAHLAWKRSRSVAGATLLAIGLLLLTYGYSTGRLLGPMTAATVAALLARREGKWNGAVLGGLLGWAAGLVPLALFAIRNPGALSRRFEIVSDVPGTHPFGVATLAWRALVEINPLFWIRSGDADVRRHLPGHAAVTLGMAALALYAVSRIVASRGRDRWLVLVLVFTLLGIVPGVITVGEHHQLRLATFAAGLLVLATCGAAELAKSRGARAMAVPLALAVAQGLAYLGGAAAAAPRLASEFNVEFEQALERAVEDPRNELWLLDCPGRLIQKAQVRWWATVASIPETRIRETGRDAPPESTILTGPSGTQFRCVRIVRRGVEARHGHLASGRPLR